MGQETLQHVVRLMNQDDGYVCCCLWTALRDCPHITSRIVVGLAVLSGLKCAPVIFGPLL